MLKRKLLLADDSITIQKVVNLTFADEGIQVISVGDGDSAMEKVREDAPDLILADVNMPGLSGYQICERIKQTAATQKIPVILLVGSFEPFDEAEAYRVGADDYLTKPFQSIRQLVTKVSDLLEAAAGKSSEIESQPASENSEAASEAENEAENVHFFNTVEILPETPIAPRQFGDEALDDEMIQTDQIGSLPVDDIQKFIADSTAGINESSAANDAPNGGFDFYRNIEPEDDFAKTEPLNIEDLRAFTSPPTDLTNGTSVYEIIPDEPQTEPQEQDIQPDEIVENQTFSGYGNFAEPENASSTEADRFAVQTAAVDHENFFDDEKSVVSESEVYEPSQAAAETGAFAFAPSSVAAAPEFSFDDIDLLDLPPINQRVDEAETQNNLSSAELMSEEEAKANVYSPQQISEVGQAEQFETRGEFAQSVQKEQEIVGETFDEAEIDRQIAALPPELIEAITRRVAEKMSDKAIREIAWEVVPQMTDLIVRRMAEEKFKE